MSLTVSSNLRKRERPFSFFFLASFSAYVGWSANEGGTRTKGGASVSLLPVHQSYMYLELNTSKRLPVPTAPSQASCVDIESLSDPLH